MSKSFLLILIIFSIFLNCLNVDAVSYSITGNPGPDCKASNTGEPAGANNGYNYWSWTNSVGTWYLWHDNGSYWVISPALNDFHGSWYCSGCSLNNSSFSGKIFGDTTGIPVTNIIPSNIAPNVPVLVSPANASNTNDTTPTLSANYSDPDTGDLGNTNYRIATSAANCLNNTSIVASGTNPTSPSTTSTNNENTTWTPGSSIGTDGTYYWCAQNDDGVAQSAWTSMGSFTLDTTPPPVPTADLTGNTYDRVFQVTLTSSGATNIYYTTNNTTPTTSSTLYTTAITIESTKTLKAIAVDGVGNTSSVMTESYIVNLPQATSTNGAGNAMMLTIIKSPPTITLAQKQILIAEIKLKIVELIRQLLEMLKKEAGN